MKHYDIVVIGAGPGGQAAALQARRLGAQTALVEMAPASAATGSTRGTIPRRTLRETAMARLRNTDDGAILMGEEEVEIASLMHHVGTVTSAHAKSIEGRLHRAGVVCLHGRARVIREGLVEVYSLAGQRERYSCDKIVLATGAEPHSPAHIPVDHQHVLDADSILSMIYLPRSLVVLGGGAIAFEFASTFAAFGVVVTVLDHGDHPLPGMEREQNQELLRAFERRGCRYMPGVEVESCTWDGLDVVVKVDGGREVRARKALVAHGVRPALKGIRASKLGIALCKNGFVKVDQHQQTSSPNIYAAGDVTGPPHLASQAMSAGQRAARHALGAEVGELSRIAAQAVYAIPELASVGMGEAEVRRQHGGVLVGVADYSEMARALIVGAPRGTLKVVCDPEGTKVLGVHVVGEGAGELVSIGHTAIRGGLGPEALVDTTFPFPTLASAYRQAAMHVLDQRDRGGEPAGRRMLGRLLGRETDSAEIEPTVTVTPLPVLSLA